MNGPEHYREAEKCIREAVEAGRDGDGPGQAYLIAEAQAHATLALVAASALSSTAKGDRATWAEWEPIVGPSR